MMHLRLSHLLFVLLGSCLLIAQGQPPARETVTATINGKKVEIDYGRPSLKGRNLNELISQLPADRMWRAGLNQVTTLTTETDLLIGSKKVSAGKYSLYVHIPESGDWSLAVNSDPGIELIKIYPKAPAAVAHALWPRLDGYQKNIADKEVARVAMKQGSAKTPADLFTMTLTPSKSGAALTMAWGDRTWAAELKTPK